MTERPDEANEFSGEARNVVQARVVHGGISLSASRRSSPPPHQLPMSPTGFVNRDAGIRELDRLLAAADGRGERGPVVLSAVAGAPGVGKTALALHWAHRVRERFTDGDLYIDMQGYGPGPPVTPMRALDAFLRALGTEGDAIPEALEDRASLFRSLLDGKRVLVVIDNASSSTQVRPLLPASRDCFTVVTSRSALPGLVAREGAARVTLDVLSPGESVELLAELVGRSRIDAAPAKARRVAELCGYLPLALRVVGERAAARPRLSLPELVDELVGEKNRLDALASAEDELSDTRAVFSWSYHALTTELRQAFRRLGLHAGPEIDPGAAAALIGTDTTTAKRRLRALADVHLVQEPSTQRFRMHDLLRRYSFERTTAEDSQEERTQAVRRVLTWYLLTADVARRAMLPYSAAVPLVPARGVELPGEFDDRSQAMDWFDRERGNILAALRQASAYGQFDIAWKLAITVSGFLELRSHWSDWEDSVRAGLEAARTLGDSFGEAVCRLILADADWRAGRAEAAAENYEAAARTGRLLSVGWIEGFALRGLGLLRKEQEDFVTAQHLFEESLRVFRSNGPHRGEGMALLSLGECARALHDIPRAVALGQDALAIFQEIGDAWTVAWGRLSLAESLAESGQAAEAVSRLREAAEAFAEFGDRRSQARALASAGDTLHRSGGDLSEARAHWRAAAELYEALGDPQAEQVRERLEDSPG
ncbi:tetratricopeptide repeat protein [Actinomadura sp. NPDC047616]|uniref:ATP-binding protein n=1 Tax=Actinomadura sp. NPDC047616 TaxID=3155914 RepID=UPI0033E5CEFE